MIEFIYPKFIYPKIDSDASYAFPVNDISQKDQLEVIIDNLKETFGSNWRKRCDIRFDGKTICQDVPDFTADELIALGTYSYPKTLPSNIIACEPDLLERHLVWINYNQSLSAIHTADQAYLDVYDSAEDVVTQHFHFDEDEHYNLLFIMEHCLDYDKAFDIITADQSNTVYISHYDENNNEKLYKYTKQVQPNKEPATFIPPSMV